MKKPKLFKLTNLKNKQHNKTTIMTKQNTKIVSMKNFT